ncbi:N6-adenosine-methyltransferase MT-A70-like protein isoform X1 [Wyeomyia smithii]|uniref:N6-adenosine-methyltransferase MT-A70-like protein isoform X1 n=1 Tax=Wyeomyia smithii TaxID=174621 RepID=UPI0024681020|nr:N6-adenosine-methyltransferase MT-A70-like protein isoform X1 [Wyeomyia smithii]
MSSWEEIQAVKVKRNTLRERLVKRKKERQDLLGGGSPGPSVVGLIKTESGNSGGDDKSKILLTAIKLEQAFVDADSEIEKTLVQVLADRSFILPTNSSQIGQQVEKRILRPTSSESILYYLQKLANQNLVNMKEVSIGGVVGYEVISAEYGSLQSLYEDLQLNHNERDGSIKRKATIKEEKDCDSKMARLTSGCLIKEEAGLKKTGESSVLSDTSDIMSLLSMPSTREKQSKKVGEEILELLTKPTAKERSLAEKFKSQGGAQVMEFCPHGTRIECLRSLEAANDAHLKKEDDDDVIISDDNNGFEIVEIKKEPDDKDKFQCNKLHFKKIIQSHTDESLGDCSFLNTCFHMDTCKYVHYEVDTYIGQNTGSKFEGEGSLSKRTADPCATLYPPQWIQCDLRYLDMTVLGKFAVVMADPPWDIHMELPYGTMSDDEMRQLGVPALQDDGLIFLWVTGRAMELGRECLKLWGYERVDELIWVKTNQLQRIIRTGRTGHWLNHGKEHCLVGMKGNPPNLNRGLDCDVIVAEVRATSHKPDEIYGIIERLSPGTRKIELFGRPHNVQPNWITLGNQLDGIRLVDPELISSFQKRYPDGNCMTPGKNP